MLAIKFPYYNKARKYTVKARSEGHLCITYQREPHVAIDLDIDDLIEDCEGGNIISCNFFEVAKAKAKPKIK